MSSANGGSIRTFGLEDFARCQNPIPVLMQCDEMNFYCVFAADSLRRPSAIFTNSLGIMTMVIVFCSAPTSGLTWL